jgi:uncharacterized membrane protein YjdF
MHVLIAFWLAIGHTVGPAILAFATVTAARCALTRLVQPWASARKVILNRVGYFAAGLVAALFAACVVSVGVVASGGGWAAVGAQLKLLSLIPSGLALFLFCISVVLPEATDDSKTIGSSPTPHRA